MSERDPDQEVRDLVEKHNNWGRWGAADELGTLNLVDEAAVLRGVRAVRVGKRVSCGHVLGPNRSQPGGSMLHFMTRSGEGAPSSGRGAAVDWIGLEFHGYGVTHLDAPSHQFWDGHMYNGHPASMVTTTTGALRCAVDAVESGVVNRGVLLDVARQRNVPSVNPSDAITYDDLVRAEASVGQLVQPGDTVLIRTGREVQLARQPAAEDAVRYAGLDASCLQWIVERDVALLGSDGVHDVVDHGAIDMNMWPIHVVALAGLGLWLLDNLSLEVLGEACALQQQWEFQFCTAPLRIKRGTGSPVNPIAIL